MTDFASPIGTSDSETEDSPNLLMRESLSNSSSLVSSLNDFLEDSKEINVPLESSMEPRPDPAPDLDLILPLFDENILNIENIPSVIQDLVFILDNLLEVNENVMKFMQNLNLEKLNLSKQVHMQDHKVSFRLNELE